MSSGGRCANQVLTSGWCVWFNVRSRVRVGDGYSEEFGVGVGVHQGSVLNPLPFIIVLEQGPVNLDYVVWNIKGSMSCTDIPLNDSSVIIIYHLLAISNGLITCLVSVLYYHLPVDADNQYRSAGVLHFIYLTIISVFVFNQNIHSNTLYLYYGNISFMRLLFKKSFIMVCYFNQFLTHNIGLVMLFTYFSKSIRETHTAQCTFNLIL